MRTVLQRWLWLVIVSGAGTVFAAEPEHGLPQYAVEIARPLRLHHQFDGRELDRGGGVDHLCPGRNAGHETCSRRSAESPGMARRGSVRFSGKHHRPAPGQADVLVSCHDFHFHSVRQLGGPHSRGRHDRVGTSDPPRFRGRSTALPRGECRSQPDARHGPRFLRLLDHLGAAGSGPGWIPQRSYLHPRARAPGS